MNEWVNDPIWYLYLAKCRDGELYVGIAKDVTDRFWKHLGTKYSWDKPGSKAFFPNFSLSLDRPWLSNETAEIFKNALFNVAVINFDKFEVSALVESFLIFYGFVKGQKPELNVQF